MKNAVILAPHPDDELISCGGTIMKLASQGWKVYWIIATELKGQDQSSKSKKARRLEQIDLIKNKLGIEKYFELKFPAGQLHGGIIPEMVSSVSEVFDKVKPEHVFLPFPGDAHTDHEYVFRSGKASCKWFRHPYVKNVYAYETISETNFDYNINCANFKPNFFVDINEHIEKKISLTEIYSDEFAHFPFPRSKEAIRALAKYRGCSSGSSFAEAFQLILSRDGF